MRVEQVQSNAEQRSKVFCKALITSEYHVVSETMVLQFNGSSPLGQLVVV